MKWRKINEINTYMPGSRRISNEVMRLLYAHSGNRCAYPDCTNPIFEDDGQLTGECCHIKAYSPGGPRYDVSQTDEERNGVDNLVLMCSRHHAIVDKNEDRYTVEVLQEYKRNHEERYSAETLRLTEEQLRYLQISSESFWKRIDEIDHNDEIWGDLKIMVEADKPTKDLLIDVEQQLDWIEQTFVTLSEDDATLAQRIGEYLVQIGVDATEYDRQLETPPYGNPFLEPHGEILALGSHNVMCELRMLYLQLVVRALERISIAETVEHPLLQTYREKLSELQEHNYYVD